MAGLERTKEKAAIIQLPGRNLKEYLFGFVGPAQVRFRRCSHRLLQGAAVNPESLKTEDNQQSDRKTTLLLGTLLLGESSLILCSFLGCCSSVKECKTAVDVVSKPFNINHVTCWEILLICVVPAIHSHLKATTINIMSRLDITTADGRNPAFVEM